MILLIDELETVNYAPNNIQVEFRKLIRSSSNEVLIKFTKKNWLKDFLNEDDD